MTDPDRIRWSPRASVALAREHGMIRASAEQRRKDRRFYIMMGTICGVIVLLFVALGWAIVATEPQRRSAYMTDCQQKGFTPEQCRFLYAERGRQEADNDVTLGLAVTALSLAASRR